MSLNELTAPPLAVAAIVGAYTLRREALRPRRMPEDSGRLIFHAAFWILALLALRVAFWDVLAGPMARAEILPQGALRAVGIWIVSPLCNLGMLYACAQCSIAFYLNCPDDERPFLVRVLLTGWRGPDVS